VLNHYCAFVVHGLGRGLDAGHSESDPQSASRAGAVALAAEGIEVAAKQTVLRGLAVARGQGY